MGSVWAPLPAGLNPAARRLVGELRALKTDHNLSLAQLSASTHYSRASWERWLNGKRLITRHALTAVATRFGADLVLLITLLGEASLDEEADREAAPEVLAASADASAQDDVPVVIAQLPASVSDFTGRCAQVEDLSAALLPGTGDPGQVSIAAVTGGGGLGKTTLAVHVAHRIAERFPDGQLYVDLNGAFENALTPETVLGQWLHVLGVAPSELPSGLEERAALYRSLLSTRRVLVVLDNARDAQQILPLLPATNECAVLITSRSRLAELPGAYKLSLTSLPDDEATILLAQLVGAARLAAEPEATAELLRACDGMPLALRIAGARLGARANWAVSTLARRLSDRRRRLDELAIGDMAARASFDVSYAALAKAGFDGALSLERAFRLLGLACGPDISLPAAAALLDLCEARAELVLEALVDTHLLESPEPDRYRMHDLIRLYAAERAMAEESEQARALAVSRLIGWYLVTAANTHAMLSPQSRPIPLGDLAPEPPAPVFASYQEALDWCERERASLVAGVIQAAEAGLGEYAWKLAAAMLGFFNARRYLADWTSTHLAALAAAQSIGDLVGEAWMWNNLGFVYFYWEETEHKALESFERSHELRVRLGDRLGEAIALNNISGAQYRLGDHAEAISTLDKAMRIREELGDMMGVGMACLNIGTVYSDNGQNAQAELYLLRALEIVDELGAEQLKLKTLNTLGAVYEAIGETAVAKKYLYAALELGSELREVDGEATALQKLAKLHAADGDRSTAIEFWQRALGLYERFNDSEAEIVRAELAAASR
ncbi:tetratricopeptide repeat protein [Actinospica sp. MGRD01-02]|uniref:Tetratricopeptide repeat protein n=1 Tax=Actinospica acidithermotolerans TaxID=2828514 RepID=A0A941IJ66_9ACTN|nr:helix-turn-helix domain-containing protein [Actinospica acidithermotolerans]MBR7825446.1 tetratricopeptide repeat protein [Actinospica acidithermotolerans]